MKHSKVVLSTTPSEGEFVDWTTPKHFAPKTDKYLPLGILSLASNLDSDVDVVILDPSSEGWNIEKTIERINQEEPDVLGLSVPTRRVYAMNKILAATSAKYKAVGGPHATYYSEQILKSGADAVFVGQLADNEFRYAVKNFPKGVIKCNTKINDIAFPRRELLDVSSYFPKTSVLFKAENRLPMFSSVGCPNHCLFCNVQEKKVQRKSSQIVLDEMQYLTSLGCGSVHILDDNFNVSANHVHGILNEMQKRGYHTEWSGRGQVRMDLGLVGRLAESGFKRIHVGLEALDDNILRFFGKNQNVEDIEKFCKAMNENHIDILGYLISGSPVETEEYRKIFPDRIRELGINYPFFNILFPEPNTKYYEALLKDGTYKKDYWAEYMENPTPYFEIPYPYGEAKKAEVLAFNDHLINEFKKR